MGRLIREYPWPATPLGPVETWPQSLRSAVSILLPSRAQIVLFWGPELVAIYNDAYAPVFGAKHPWALGRPARECWSEVWHVLGPLFEGVVRTGEAFWAKDHPFLLHRQGFLEETFFDVSYDPVRIEDGSVGGIFCIVSDQTGRVLGDRRLRALTELGSRTADAKSAEEVCREAAAALAIDPADVPFALLYLVEGTGPRPELVGAAGVEPRAVVTGPDAVIARVEALAAGRDGRAVEVETGVLVAGAPASAADRALALPIASGQQIVGLLVAGVSRYLRLAGTYRDFFDLLAARISAAVASARAYEEERRRAEALAELDRAKTAFFSNVSHEFRTPLTLMLGPVEDLLARPADPARPAQRELLEIAHRNGLRLEKLVNTLLDFARIEAGRVRAVYEPTDLGPLTAELASNFQSACERAGLRLRIECPPLPGSVHVDREMWEKIVLNLVSNAFKFTFEGEIAVGLRPVTGGVELTVRDTGIGIAAEEIPHLFERFYRVRGAPGRTHEGTGIGLALVQELVRLHGGATRVESAPGAGSTFSITIPTGTAHLPAERIGSAGPPAPAATAARAYVEEALRWLPDRDSPAPAPADHEPVLLPTGPSPVIGPRTGAGAAGRRPRILWADDNADLRAYVRRLLEADYDVEAVADGTEALAAARARRPDLVLADVMMPHLDGFELLRALRTDPDTRTLPVILLSARAGEESRIEGLEAGADDYLVKPFSARELSARVTACLRLAEVRRDAERAIREREEAVRESERRFRTLANVAPAIIWTAAPDGTIAFASDRWFEYTGLSRDENPRHWTRVLHPDDVERCTTAWAAALATGTEYEIEVRNRGRDGLYRWFITRATPVRDGAGRIEAWFGSTTDIHDRKRIEIERERLLAEHRRQREVLERLVAHAPIAIAVVEGPDLRYTLVNPAYQSIVGPEVTVLGRTVGEVFPEAAERGAEEGMRQALCTGRPWRVRDFETPIPGRAGMTWWDGEVVPMPESAESLLVLTWEITDRKRAETALREANRAKDEFLAMLSHELRNPLGAIGSAVRVLGAAVGPDATAARAHAVIDRQVAHLARLVDDLLDVGRVTAGKIVLDRRPVDLAGVAAGVVSAWRAAGRLDRHRVTVEAEAVWVDADETRLEQVVTNLLDNALKFTPGDGAVTVRVGPQDREAVLEVQDTGSGMTPDLIEGAFDLFVQGLQASDRRQGGLGIGLTLVRRLVERHGGTVAARSAGPGLGSVLSVRLPAIPAPPRPVPPALDRRAGESRRILIVEDNDDAREMMRLALELQGHTVVAAADGPRGIDLAATGSPDIAFIDIGLPGLDGYEVGRRLRASAGPAITLVALTGYGTAQDRERAEQAGFDLHLVKPVDPARLLAVIGAAPREGE
jgi:PAS domain S-box-containing protein